MALACKQALVEHMLVLEEHMRASGLEEACMLAWLALEDCMLAWLAEGDCMLVWLAQVLCKLEQLCWEQHRLGWVEQWRLEQVLEEH